MFYMLFLSQFIHIDILVIIDILSEVVFSGNFDPTVSYLNGFFIFI